RCNVNIKFDMNLIPSFRVPDNYSVDEYLKKLCYEGAKKRYESRTS
ncbi:unnamed protein product, partial [marine sediment metagenome]